MEDDVTVTHRGCQRLRDYYGSIPSTIQVVGGRRGRGWGIECRAGVMAHEVEAMVAEVDGDIVMREAPVEAGCASRPRPATPACRVLGCRLWRQEKARQPAGEVCLASVHSR